MFGVGVGLYSIGEVAVFKRLMENKFGFNEHCRLWSKRFYFFVSKFSW